MNSQSSFEESPTCLTSSSTFTYDYSPRSANELFNALSYPREITIASTPLKSNNSNKSSPFHAPSYHVNHAYNFVNDDLTNIHSNHLPQSIERQLAHNLNNMQQISSVSYQIDMNDFFSKSNSSDSDPKALPHAEWNSLRDEDAWLPILSIAEEEVRRLNIDFALLISL